MKAAMRGAAQGAAGLTEKQPVAEIDGGAPWAQAVAAPAGADFPGIPVTPLLLSVEEGAAQLRIGRSRMFALIRQGDVLSVMVGGSRRIPYDALKAYVNRLVAQQAPPAA